MQMNSDIGDLAKQRSSRSQILFKTGVLKNFANFTGKHMCWSLFLIKLQVCRQSLEIKQLIKAIFGDIVNTQKTFTLYFILLFSCLSD